MSNDNNIAKYKNIIIFVLSSIMFIVLFFCSFSIVKSGEVGIKTRFGKVVTTQMDEGVNVMIPFIEDIFKINVRVQKMEIDVSSASKDLQDVDMRIAVNYRVKYDKAISLYKNVGIKYRETILQPSIQESIKAVTSKYTAEQLITIRNEISLKAMEVLEKKLIKYGIDIEDFNITDFTFSKEFNKAIEEKQVAEQKVLTAKQELEKEKIEAEKKIVKAQSEKTANELKQQSLTSSIIEEKFIDKWNGELPKVSGSNSILDVSSILGNN